MKKYFCIYFIASGTCFEQTFFVQASSESQAKSELLRQAKGADIRNIVEVEYNHRVSYAIATEERI